jgi:hypothetical protein
MEPSKRKVISRSPSHTVRLIHLPHVQPEPVEADSNPERFFVHIAALYPFIRKITDQPFRLVLGERKYTPDYLLEFLDGSRLVIEVKPASRLKEYEELFVQATSKLHEYGYGFLVAKDIDITRDELASRALRIRRYCKTRFKQEACKRVINLVEKTKHGIAMGELTRVHNISFELVLHLIGFHQLCTDNNLSIDENAIVKSTSNYKQEIEYEYQSHAIHFGSWFDTQDRS